MCGENKLVSLEGLKDTMRIDALKSSDNKVSFKEGIKLTMDYIVKEGAK